MRKSWRNERNCEKKNICAYLTYASTHALNLRICFFYNGLTLPFLIRRAR